MLETQHKSMKLGYVYQQMTENVSWFLMVVHALLRFMSRLSPVCDEFQNDPSIFNKKGQCVMRINDKEGKLYIVSSYGLQHQLERV